MALSHGFFVVLLLALPGSMGSGQTLVGVGYENPQMLHIAPGQVTTFFLTGANTVLAPGSSLQRAAQTPLPVSLAGFSATISQQPWNVTEPLPLIQVYQFTNCSNSAQLSRDCVITGITVQIPVDLHVDCGGIILCSMTATPQSPVIGVDQSFKSPLLPQDGLHTTTTVAIADGGGVSQAFNVLLLPQDVHIVTTCDAGLPNSVLAIVPGACSSAVTHADGRLVTPSYPAKSGEELAMYAFGLGATSPTVPAGQPAPSPAPVATGQFSLSFAYTGTLASSSQTNPAPISKPVFVGLSPGEVGLYQVNFVVQQAGGVVSGCDGNDQANLRVILSTSLSPSFDTARVCVVAGN